MAQRTAWQGTRGPTTLPKDWTKRREQRRRIARGRCECDGTCGRHEQRCSTTGSELDHHNDDHNDHAIKNLRWLCNECHRVKTLKKAREARTRAREALRHSSTKLSHPGLT